MGHVDTLQARNEVTQATLEEVNSASCSTEEANLILNFICGSQSLKCLTTSGEGRSLYISRDQKEECNEKKIKGGGGLRREKLGRLNFYSPQHHVNYSQPVNHAFLKPDLEFEVKRSSRKALNSLSASGAKMEYRAQKRLSEQNLGFDGLCWGKFGTKVLAKTDLHGTETGFVASRADATYLPMDRMLERRDVHTGAISRIVHDRLSPDKLEFHFSLVERLGKIKRRMAEKAQLGRHSSTLGNFLYSSDKDDILVTDTDTVIDYKDLISLARGAQFLRDGVSDLMKRISELYFDGMNRSRVGGIIEETANSFIRGLFNDSVQDKRIETFISMLNIEDCISSVGVNRNNGSTAGWVYIGGSYPELYKAFYILFLESDLKDLFPIASLCPDELYERAYRFYMENNVT